MARFTLLSAAARGVINTRGDFLSPVYGKSLDDEEAKVVLDLTQHTDPAEWIEVSIDFRPTGTSDWIPIGSGLFPGVSGGYPSPTQPRPPAVNAGLAVGVGGDLRVRFAQQGRFRWGAEGDLRQQIADQRG